MVGKFKNSTTCCTWQTTSDVLAPPSNFDAGPMESALRFWAKLPALTSQTRGYNTFVKQVSARIHEFLCLSRALRSHQLVGTRERALNRTNRTASAEDDKRPKIGGTRFRIYCSTPNGTPDTTTRGVATFRPSRVFQKKTAKTSFTVIPVIENYLRFQPKEDFDWIPPTREGADLFWELHT